MEKFVFEEPSEIYRGLDLWMVNDKLSDEEIALQVREFKAKGLYSVIFRTYDGLISDYPGPDFKHKLRIAVETAKDCGLKIVLQAGYMPAAIPGLPEEYALHRILPIHENELTGDENILSSYNGYAFTTQVVPSALNMLDEASVDYYLKMTYEDMWSEFSDEFGKTIISVWVDEPRFENRYLTWTSKLGDIFEKKYGYRIEPHIPALYYNIGDYKKVRYHYFTLLRDIMANGYYSKVRDWCHSKNLTFSGHLMAEERLHMQIAQSVAVMPYYKYFDIPGIDNLRCNNDWYDRPLKGQSKWHEIAADKARFMGAIQCVSAAEQAGKEHILCEMYGVTSPSFVFRDQMHLFDFFAVNGINHQCMHALFYSPRGFRKRFYPQTFNRYVPFWENFKNIKDYVARVSAFISQGKCTKDILILHPLETAYGLFRGLTDVTNETPRDEVLDYDNRNYKFITDLYSMRINCHLGDLATIDATANTQNGILSVGEMNYNTLVLPDIEVISEKLYRLIKKFSADGGKIFICGNTPSRIDGIIFENLENELLSLAGVTYFENRELLLRALKNLECGYSFDCEEDASQTYINHRVDEKHHYFMIHNGDCKAKKHCRIILEGNHKAFRFDAEQNAVSEIYAYAENGKTIISFENVQGGSMLIFTKECKALPECPKKPELHSSVALEDVRTEVRDDNVLTLEICTYKTEDMADFTKNEIAIERVVETLKQKKYTGEIMLKYKFYSDFKATGLKLIMEDPEECSVVLNGKSVDTKDTGYYYSTAFRIIKLPDYVVPGENTIEITRHTSPIITAAINDDMKHLFELFRTPKGTDLERVHLLGDFSVEALPEYPTGGGIVRYSKRFFLKERYPMANNSDIISHGYPFYPGAVYYTATTDIGEDLLKSENIFIKAGVFNGCSATVFVNGNPAGFLDREPYVLPIKKHLKAGKNSIEIKLLGTFRNMFGPSHFEGADPSGCNRDMWILDFKYTTFTEYDNGTLTNSFQLIPYGIGNLSLEFH